MVEFSGEHLDVIVNAIRSLEGANTRAMAARKFADALAPHYYGFHRESFIDGCQMMPGHGIEQDYLESLRAHLGSSLDG